MKIASRYLLPLELFLSILVVSWGLSGWLGGGLLWKALREYGLNDEFGVVLCATGLLQFIAAALEWFWGRRWDCSRMLTSVRARSSLGFVSVVIWVYVVYTVLTLPSTGVAWSLTVQAPAALLFQGWVFVGNYFTACVLDPDTPTERVKAQLRAERAAALRDEAFGGQ